MVNHDVFAEKDAGSFIFPGIALPGTAAAGPVIAVVHQKAKDREGGPFNRLFISCLIKLQCCF